MLTLTLTPDQAQLLYLTLIQIREDFWQTNDPDEVSDREALQNLGQVIDQLEQHPEVMSLEDVQKALTDYWGHPTDWPHPE